MNTSIHKIFTRQILNEFNIPKFDKMIIVFSDVSQDLPFRSLNHYGDVALKKFNRIYSKYKNKEKSRHLGKLLHYLLDISTPIHEELRLNPKILIFVHKRNEDYIEGQYSDDYINKIIKSYIRTSYLSIDIEKEIEIISRDQKKFMNQFIHLCNYTDDIIIPHDRKDLFEKTKSTYESTTETIREDQSAENVLKYISTYEKKTKDLKHNNSFDILKMFLLSLAMSRHIDEIFERVIPIALLLINMKYKKMS